MTRKRDGPASDSTTPGPEQKDEVSPRLLPPLKTPRKGHTSPSSHRRVRRRQPQGWRQFNVRVVTGPDSEAVHALHSFLREAARRYGLTIVRIDKIGNDDKSE
jgi:hypothetical protein